MHRSLTAPTLIEWFKAAGRYIPTDRAEGLTVQYLTSVKEQITLKRNNFDLTQQTNFSKYM
jgi:hypothetical protein